MHNHERLEAWQRAIALNIDLCAAADRYRGKRYQPLLNQIRRAVGSIPANIAEGAGQSTDAQFARFVDIAIGSAQETHSHVYLAQGLRLFRHDQAEGWLNELSSIRRMLNGLSRHLRNQPRRL